MKIICFLICLCYLVNIASPSAVDCDYKIGNFVMLREKYKCEVQNVFEIKSKNSSLITGVIGLHKSKIRNDNVAVFSVKKYTVNYFPTGLEKIFKNLEGISISFCRLKEIHQNDLKTLPKLTYLDLNDNDIEVIEAGIFEFNKNLKLVWFKRNKIHHIDLNVFDGLSALTNLNLMGNKCTNSKGFNVTEVQKVIQGLNSTCTNQEYLTKKFNETEAAKLDEQLTGKNESLTNTNQNSTNIHDFLLSSIESLVTKKMEENFIRSQELFTTLSKKVDKLEQDLTETKKQLTESYNISSKSSNEALDILKVIQQHQTEQASNLINSLNKCDTLADKIPNDLTNTLNSIQETQKTISQELLNKETQSSTLSQTLEQVNNTLSNIKIYLAGTIETTAKQIKSDQILLKEDIKEVKIKMSDMGTEVKAIKTNLESFVKESQNSESLDITPNTEAPNTEAPNTKASNTEAPNTEAPNTEAPNTEAPKTEAPNTQAPNTQASNTETPKTEAPKTEAPKTEAPNTKAPNTEAPKTEASNTETPKTEAPITETPNTESPKTEAPNTQVPNTETKKTEAPITETPITEVSKTEAPITETPNTEAPKTEAPITETPNTEAPKTENSNTKAPSPEGPLTN